MVVHSIIDELDLGPNHLFLFVFECLPLYKRGVQGERVFAYQGLLVTEV
jgi:hypothetical protein